MLFQTHKAFCLFLSQIKTFFIFSHHFPSNESLCNQHFTAHNGIIKVIHVNHAV